MTAFPGWVLVVLFGGTFALAWAATGGVLRVLRHHNVLDLPNARSSHSIPTPRGGGWGVLAALVPAWLAVGAWAGDLDRLAYPMAGLVALVAVSWLDDIRTVSPLLRLAVQVLAVAMALAGIDAPVFQGLLPLPLDRLVAALAWIWFVNLYNFMDGIDGITGTETATIGLGLVLVAAAASVSTLAAIASPLVPYALALAAAALGFLVWNWHPARIFLGDVGSVPLGFLIGWLLLRAAQDGLWLPALILPLYYLVDATATLGRRLLRGEKVWQAHRSHVYQQAVQRGRRHDQVVRAIALANLGLILVAVGSVVATPWLGLLAPAVVAVLVRHLLNGSPAPATTVG